MPDPQADYEIDIDWREAGVQPQPQAPPAVPVAFRAPVQDRPRRDDDDDDRELAVVQAAAVRADGGEISDGAVIGAEKVELLGRSFRLADATGIMPLMKFSAAADLTTADGSKALAAMYALLRDLIHADDWAAFENHAIDTKAEAEDVFDVMNKAMEIVAGRPTKPAAGSSAGRRATQGG